MNEQRTGAAIEVLNSVEQRAISNVISRAGLAVGLSPWEQYKLEWQVRRERGKLILQLAQLEGEAVVAETIISVQGRVARGREQAALAVLDEQLRCVVAAGHMRDNAISEASRCSEDSRDIIKDTIEQITMRYVRGVEKRAGRAV